MNEINRQIEQQLLGAIIWLETPIDRVAWLNPQDFSFPEHQVIWKVIKNLYEKKNPINELTVWEAVRLELMKGRNDFIPLTDDYILALTDGVEGLHYLAKDVHSLGRSIRGASLRTKLAEGLEPEEAKSLINEMAVPQETKVFKLKDIITEQIKELGTGEHLNNMGLSTGLKPLDKYIVGLKKCDLIVLSGRPSSGKTTLALNIALNVAEQGIDVAYFNLEMSGKQLANKIISRKAQINSTSFNEKIIEHDLKKMFQYGNNLSELPLKIVDKGSTTLEEIRTLLKTDNLGLVVIDQLLKVRTPVKRNRLDQEIADITFGLKEMAKEFEIPVLLLHQVNREVEKRADKRPMLADLRDSGSIEQDADIVIFIHRDILFDEMADSHKVLIRVAKNKMGIICDIAKAIKFYGEFSEFKENDGSVYS